MSSKFNRPARTQRAPAVCRKPPQPGPFDPTWPPKAATGLCKWEGPNPSGDDYFVQGLCELHWNPGPQEYSGQVTTGQDLVTIRATLNVSPPYLYVYYDYWMGGVYKRSAFSYHHDIQTGHPIVIAADFMVRPDLTHQVMFRLSAFPLT